MHMYLQYAFCGSSAHDDPKRLFQLKWYYDFKYLVFLAEPISFWLLVLHFSSAKESFRIS